jgi:hypothetical protein
MENKIDKVSLSPVVNEIFIELMALIKEHSELFATRKA